MKMHEFSIIASGLNQEADDFETRFFDAGCDDATISFQKGHIIADFAREAASLEDAISSAVEAVSKAGATVDRVEPDPLVSLSDMAARTGLTRTTLSNYSQGKRGSHFPAPIARVTSESPLWDWATVARWMYENEKLGKEAALNAEIVRQANVAICNGESHLGEKLRKVAQEYAEELEAA
jgi:transcriptional regulator with XRE-family HTH domain